MMLRSECRASSRCDNGHSILSCTTLITIFIVVNSVSVYFLYDRFQQKHEEIKLELHDLVIEQVKQFTRKEIDLYDADKTNKADYALEPSGGIIVSTKCSKTYLEGNIEYSINGVLPVYWTSISPRIVIQRTKVTPGECWAFKGAEGKLVIKLSRRIVPTAFTYEHIRKELSPDLNIDSAPRHFRVKSLKDENDEDGLLLGEYEYNENDGPLQQFEVQNPHPIPTEFIELHILSNHGEMKFTCLYRFRVHGNRL